MRVAAKYLCASLVLLVSESSLEARTALTTGTTWYVNHASGDDENDCLSPQAPCATIARAVAIINNDIDCRGHVPTIQVADGTFTEGFISVTQKLVGYNYIQLTGNPSSPGNVVWQVPSSAGLGMQIRDHGVVVVSGFKFVGLGTGQTPIQVSQGGVLDIANVEFGTFSGGYHLQSYQGGSINVGAGSYVISGNVVSHWWLQGAGSNLVVVTSSISMPSALTFSDFLSVFGPSAFLIVNTSFTGTGSGNGSVGKKYEVQLNGSARLIGTTLPGSSAGTYGTNGTVLNY